MRTSQRILRTGGHRRGDLWTSGRRTTNHHTDLYDQMVVTQTTEEKRIQAQENASTPADISKMRTVARVTRDHYRASTDALGLQPTAVKEVGGAELTSRPSYLGPTVLSGHAGEQVSQNEISVGSGIRQNQFVYYDDTGHRLQHPVTANMMKAAGLATQEELADRLAEEYRKALPTPDPVAIYGQSKAIGSGTNNDSAPSPLHSLGASASSNNAVTAAAESTEIRTSECSSVAAPSHEVAALTRVQDKRDLLYNSKLRAHWDAANEDPVRGSSYRGPKRNVATGGTITRGTERNTLDEYYDNNETLSETGASMGTILKASDPNADSEATQVGSTVFELGEDAFRRSRLAKLGGNEEEVAASAEASNNDQPSEAELDPKYASQRVDLNNPRVGPEFFKGADIAMDADLRRALDKRMQATREGKVPPSLSSLLGKKGSYEAGSDKDAEIERRLDEKDAAKAQPQTESDPAPKVNKASTAGPRSIFNRLFGGDQQFAEDRQRAQSSQPKSEDEIESERGEKLNARLGIRKARATPGNSASGRRNPLTYDKSQEMSGERLMLDVLGAAVQVQLPTGDDSRELFSGGFDFMGNRRKGSNSYTESANASGRFANRLTANYFANDNLHAGMMASGKYHADNGKNKRNGADVDAGSLSAAAARNKAFSQFQNQAKEDPFGASRNIGVGAGGISAVSNAQSSGGSGVGSSFSNSEEGSKVMKQFTFRQALKQLDQSRFQPTNHDELYSDVLKYLEAYVDMSGLVMSSASQDSSVNVAQDNDATDVLLPRAALRGRLVGLLFYTDSERCKEFLQQLEAYQAPYRGDLVILGIGYGSYERRDLMRRHRFCCIPPAMGSRYVARDAGFKGSWWSPFPVLYIVDGTTGKVVSHYGYASILRNPERCFEEWARGEQGARLRDIALARFGLFCREAPEPRMAKRVISDFGLKEKI